MNFSLRQLRYAVALADTLSFGRAARRSHVTQSALSQQMTQLEQACGVPLFDRLGRSVRPTPFGREFIARARRVLDEAEQVQSLIAGQSSPPTRPIRFGLIPTVAPYLLPEVFPLLQAEFPSTAFVVIENRTDGLMQALMAGEIDLALIATDAPAGKPRLVSRALFDDRFLLATGPGDEVMPKRLADIPPDRILLLSEGHCFRDQAIAACGIAGDTPTSTFAATSLATIVEFVANGQGVTLLPEIAMRKETTGKRINIHSLPEPGPSRTLSLVWREATPYADLFDRVATVIRSMRRGQAAAA